MVIITNDARTATAVTQVDNGHVVLSDGGVCRHTGGAGGCRETGRRQGPCVPRVSHCSQPMCGVTIVADCWNGQVHIQTVHGRSVGIMMMMGMGRLLSLCCPSMLTRRGIGFLSFMERGCIILHSKVNGVWRESIDRHTGEPNKGKLSCPLMDDQARPVKVGLNHLSLSSPFSSSLFSFYPPPRTLLLPPTSPQSNFP